MPKRKATQGLADIFKKTEPGAPGAAAPNLAQPRGLSLRAAEWAEIDELAKRVRMTPHALTVWLVRYALKAYREGRIETKPAKVETLPDL